jgi:hypothetical protein
MIKAIGVVSFLGKRVIESAAGDFSLFGRQGPAVVL